MSLTPDEAAEIKQSVRSLQKSHDEVLSAIKDNTDSVNNLVIEFSKRDVRDEYLEKELNETKNRQQDFEQFARPILVKTKDKQDFEQKIKDSFGSSTGKLIYIIVALGLAAALGMDLSGLIK